MILAVRQSLLFLNKRIKIHLFRKSQFFNKPCLNDIPNFKNHSRFLLNFFVAQIYLVEQVEDGKVHKFLPTDLRF